MLTFPGTIGRTNIQKVNILSLLNDKSMDARDSVVLEDATPIAAGITAEKNSSV
jgi:hypothetical protein